DCEAVARRLDELSDPMIRSLQRVLAPGADQPTTPPQGEAATQPRPDGEGGGPRRLGVYELVEELGRGGMGVVYKARQTSPSRLVALKMLLGGDYADPDRRARFLAEGDAIARLQHPNIVQIFEVGQHEGLPFLVLEYVGGGTLADRLQGVPQPPRQA